MLSHRGAEHKGTKSARGDEANVRRAFNRFRAGRTRAWSVFTGGVLCEPVIVGFVQLAALVQFVRAPSRPLSPGHSGDPVHV